ncbi:PAS domain-containing sensor histidine kinase [Chlorogloea sp. CCALA 695]|uniref:PAS domain-containing sensor histidine kinase n=1 Tax=Chlorogloea sp. CCALA 695 TaxID=2107693 RepID=UPI000D06C816|nr:PAS domain-containing sensor histidine kinase [Chlorogloea sp. CCALA 695]PSB24459.1 hybrid sensor histidine kinase/response regulator [Chlorogloea sp. CCALA 695]
MIIKFIENLFDLGQFVSHGHCYLWNPYLLGLHIVGDLLIALAYYSIPVMLFYFVRQRQDVPFKGIFLLFAAFIVSCGTTHLMEIWTLWYPTYWLAGGLKVITAIVSLYTASELFDLIPEALVLPSPTQWEIANQNLSQEIRERQQAEEMLLQAHNELEDRVSERTSELSSALLALQKEIAEREQANKLLHQSMQRYRFLADAMPQIVWTARPDGFLDYYNERWYNYTGMTLEQTEGSGWGSVLHPEDLQLCIDQWTQAYQTGKSYEIEYRFKRASDGAYRWYLGRALPMKNENGKIVQWVGTGTDIDDQKQVEAELRSALEKEKELSLLKSAIVTMTSHEFRTPLTTILSSAEILECYSHKFTEAKKLEHLQRIQRAVKHMNGLLSDVLLIGKAEAGKLEFNPTSLELEQYCRKLVEEIQLTTNTHTIVFGKQGECVDAYMDEKLLLHIFSNLLSNAIKYSPQGGTIRFDLIYKLGEVIFQIQDEGIGIPNIDQAQLFNSFQRGSNVGTISGTGLGLAIVKKSVDLHGGQIWVESEVNIGTAFIVTLPLNNRNLPDSFVTASIS